MKNRHFIVNFMSILICSQYTCTTLTNMYRTLPKLYQILKTKNLCVGAVFFQKVIRVAYWDYTPFQKVIEIAD